MHKCDEAVFNLNFTEDHFWVRPHLPLFSFVDYRSVPSKERSIKHSGIHISVSYYSYTTGTAAAPQSNSNFWKSPISADSTTLFLLRTNIRYSKTCSANMPLQYPISQSTLKSKDLKFIARLEKPFVHLLLFKKSVIFIDISLKILLYHDDFPHSFRREKSGKLFFRLSLVGIGRYFGQIFSNYLVSV